VSSSCRRHLPRRRMAPSSLNTAARPGPTRRSSWSASGSRAMSSPGVRVPANPVGRSGSQGSSSTRGAYLSATLPEQAPDGLFLVWARNSAGFSRPVVLNKPEPWWCGPAPVRPGDITRVFGRNLSRRPDFARGFVYVCKPGQQGVWATHLHLGSMAGLKRPFAFAIENSLSRSQVPGQAMCSRVVVAFTAMAEDSLAIAGRGRSEVAAEDHVEMTLG
jgi:hypothetical protein